MFGLDDEEDEDFMVRPEASSKLANLFERNELKLDIESSNKTLIYTPPKQPKKIEINSSADNPNTTTSAVMTLIKASAVNVFKYENDKYSAQGKLGAALLGNHDTGSYKLILYTGRQQHITYASVNENFKLICQPNLYISFYDDNRQNWSVMFDTDEEKCDFSLQLTVCKHNSIPKSEKKSLVVTQDLMVGNESSPIVAEDNDNIELKYKGWLFEDNLTVGKLFVNVESTSKKSLKLKISGKWTQVLKGMKIGGKRFAIFTAELKDELNDIMESAPLGHNYKYGFEFELLKIQTRVQHKTQKSETKPQIETKVETKDQMISSSEERRSHSSSVSDSLKEETIKPKSDILSRVARMGGLPIFPIKPTEPLDTTDTIEDDCNHSTKPFPKPRNNSLISNSTQSVVSSNNWENTSFAPNIPHYPTNPMTNTSYSTPIPPYFMPQSIESNLSILTAEMRTNSSEIRLNLSKVLDKIDSISEKVTEIKLSPNMSTNSMATSSLGFMDSAILLSSIQRIVDENNGLKKELEEKTSNLQKLNEKICDLLSQQNSSSSAGQELERVLLNESRVKRDLIVLSEECVRIRAKSEELNEENSRLRHTISDLQIQSQRGRTVSHESNKVFVNQMKKVMNELFRKISAQISDNESYRSDEIIEIVSNCIRSSTLSAIESRNSSRTTSPYRQPVDEIDRNKSKVIETNAKELEKPPIPTRKPTESQQQIDKSVNNSENTTLSQESIETTEQ